MRGVATADLAPRPGRCRWYTRAALKAAMVELPTWIAPGDAATLVWHSGRGEGADGAAVYLVAGPALDMPPASPHFLLAPADRDEFADRLYRGLVDLDEPQSLLGDCVLVQGEMSPTLDRVVVAAATPALPLLDAWRASAAPSLLPYDVWSCRLHPFEFLKEAA